MLLILQYFEFHYKLKVWSKLNLLLFIIYTAGESRAKNGGLQGKGAKTAAITAPPVCSGMQQVKLSPKKVRRSSEHK